MMITLLKKALQANNITLSDHTISQLIYFLDELSKWNHIFNLTSITKPEEMVYLHIIDSLLIAPYLHGKRYLDVGSGAGIPGIPLALMCEDSEWVLLDKCGKKARFMRQMKAELGLAHVEISDSRVEHFHPQARFDSIISRAYGTLRLLTESTKHLLAEDGEWLLMKGKYPEEELNDVPSFLTVRDVTSIKMKGRILERHLVTLTAS